MLQATGLTKKYGEYIALNGLTLTVEQGEVFCLLGQNSAGKTTTINLFLGFTEAASGTASVNGITIQPNDTASKKHIAYIPEVVMLYGNLTGLENLDFFSRLAGYKYDASIREKFLTGAGLQKEAQGKKVSSYSKGMRQKVGIAVALAKNADAIFMDEPTSGLDPKATAEFTRLCKELSAKGKTIFMATHDIFNAVNVGSRIGIMKAGNLVHTLPVSSVTVEGLQQLYLKTI